MRSILPLADACGRRRSTPRAEERLDAVLLAGLEQLDGAVHDAVVGEAERGLAELGRRGRRACRSCTRRPAASTRSGRAGARRRGAHGEGKDPRRTADGPLCAGSVRVVWPREGGNLHAARPRVPQRPRGGSSRVRRRTSRGVRRGSAPRGRRDRAAALAYGEGLESSCGAVGPRLQRGAAAVAADNAPAPATPPTSPRSRLAKARGPS